MDSWSKLGGHVRKLLAATGALALAGLAAGCSSSATLVNHPAGASSGSVARVGDTLDLQNQAGRHFEMTLAKVVDHAHGTNNSSPGHNKRFIAILFAVRNTSDQALNTDGNADANLVGSNGQIYLPAHVTLRECGGETTQFQLAGGKSGTSCVAFEVNNEVPIAKVQFFPAAGAAKDYGEWLVH
jgi:hypothetical protein